MIRPLRRWGQNWLASERLAEDLAALIAPREGERFLEIGPGRGRLTRALLNYPVTVFAVEVDPRCCAELGELQINRLTVVEADILRSDDVVPWGKGRVRVVGNLPYNVSSPILRWTVERADRIVDAHYMLQEEVAERAAAPPGTKQYGWISVILSWVFEVKVVKRLSPGAFRPPPKVNSAFVRLRPRLQAPAPALREAASTLAAGAFGHRRKKWPKAMQLAGLPGDELRVAAGAAGISPDLRAADLAPDDYLALATAMTAAESEG